MDGSPTDSVLNSELKDDANDEAQGIIILKGESRKPTELETRQFIDLLTQIAKRVIQERSNNGHQTS